MLETTHHLQLWREDLERLGQANIFDLRYPVPWHRIEAARGRFDWRWMDAPMEFMEENGFAPILDPLHHVSFPEWLAGGFGNPAFPELYLRFIEEVAHRYPWATRYTVLNEPLPTLVLCALTGDWYPYCHSDRAFVGMGINVARAICLATAKLQALNPAIQFFHIDSCEHHRALDERAERWVRHANARRFLFHDLVLGRVNKQLMPYLVKAGFTEAQRCWFEEHPAKIDVLGLDYYAHSEIDWELKGHGAHPSISFPCKKPRGFAEVARDYVERYKLPVFLSETNIGGCVEDRITWLRFMEQEAEKVAEFADFRGFCWFPSVDATDWNSLCTRADKCVSPVGIWSLSDDRRTRHDTELSNWYVQLANGRARGSDLPAYDPAPPLDRDLLGYLPLWTRSPALSARE